MIYIMVASLLWGLTNPFLKSGAAGLENISHEKLLINLFLKVKWLISNPQFLIPFSINQVGSVVYYYVLTIYPISIAVPVVNALTLLITVVTGHFLCDELLSIRQTAGLLTIATGIVLCSLSNQ